MPYSQSIFILDLKYPFEMPQADMESSSGLIMSVIRILTNSKDDAERDLIKQKLEGFLIKSNENLTKLVADNHEELRIVMQSFTSISDNLQTSLMKLAKAKQRLRDCCERLTQRLEELRRLSDESKKNEKVLDLLDQVDELLRVPTDINELINDRKYLEAAKLLVEKQNYIEDKFEAFECLKEVSSELDGKRDELYRILREKLFLLEQDDPTRDDIIESLKMIDKTPELPDLEVAKEDVENAPTTKPSLFKFSLSSHAICFNEHYKEQNEVTKTLLLK